MREARHLARCRSCRESERELGPALSALATRPLTDWEREHLWLRVRAAIDARERRRLPLLSMSRVLGWLRGQGRRRPALMWGLATAAAIVLVLAPLHLGRERGILTQAELNAQTTIERIEVGPATSVVILETPGDQTKIIWVVGPE